MDKITATIYTQGTCITHTFTRSVTVKDVHRWCLKQFGRHVKTCSAHDEINWIFTRGTVTLTGHVKQVHGYRTRR